MTHVQSIMQQGIWSNDVFQLKSELDRNTYTQINEVLERFGGKWNKKQKGHVFDFDVDTVKSLINDYVENGVLPEKNPLAFFATPQEVINDMLPLAHIMPNMSILEPSAGMGAFVKALTNMACEDITALELDNFRYNVLKKSYPSVNTINVDFLEWQTDRTFDVVVMNPPFAVDGNKTCYVDHVMKAWSMLDSGGKLLSVLPMGWLTSSTKKLKEFREFVYENGTYYKFPKKTFKESGTGVNTLFICLEKLSPALKNKYFTEPCSGYLNAFVWELEVTLESDYQKYQQKCDLLQKLKNGVQCDEEIRKYYQSGIDWLRQSEVWMPFREEWMSYLIKEFKKALDNY